MKTSDIPYDLTLLQGNNDRLISQLDWVIGIFILLCTLSISIQFLNGLRNFTSIVIISTFKEDVDEKIVNLRRDLSDFSQDYSIATFSFSLRGKSNQIIYATQFGTGSGIRRVNLTLKSESELFSEFIDPILVSTNLNEDAATKLNSILSKNITSRFRGQIGDLIRHSNNLAIINPPQISLFGLNISGSFMHYLVFLLASWIFLACRMLRNSLSETHKILDSCEKENSFKLDSIRQNIKPDFLFLSEKNNYFPFSKWVIILILIITVVNAIFISTDLAQIGIPERHFIYPFVIHPQTLGFNLLSGLLITLSLIIVRISTKNID